MAGTSPQIKFAHSFWRETSILTSHSPRTTETRDERRKNQPLIISAIGHCPGCMKTSAKYTDDQLSYQAIPPLSCYNLVSKIFSIKYSRCDVYRLIGHKSSLQWHWQICTHLFAWLGRCENTKCLSSSVVRPKPNASYSMSMHCDSLPLGGRRSNTSYRLSANACRRFITSFLPLPPLA